MNEITRMGGLIAFEHEMRYLMPPTPDELAAQKSKSWFSDAFDSQLPRRVMFPTMGTAYKVGDDNVDELISALRRLPSVDGVFLGGTTITPVGSARIRESLPNCRVKQW